MAPRTKYTGHGRVLPRIVAGTVSACLLLTACGASDQEKQASGEGTEEVATTLEFPNFQGGEAPFSTWWSEFIDAYEEKYPDVTVETTDVQQSNSYADVLQTRLPAHDPPDVIQMTSTNFARLAAPGWLMPLDDMLQDTNVPGKWGKLQDTYVWEGKTLGVMTLAGGDVMYYNEKLLDEAGVEVPTTPEELISAANAIYDPDNGIYGFIGVSAPQDGKLYSESSQFVYGMGGQWADGDELTFTDPDVEAALEVYRAAMETSPKGLSENQRNELFYSGQAAFMFEGNYFGAGIQQNADPAIAATLRPAAPPFPTPAGSTAVFLAIPSGLSPARQANAEAFVKLALTPEWQERYAELVGVPAPDPDSIKNLEADNPDLRLFAQLASQAVNYIPTGPKVVERLAEIRKLLFDHLVAITTAGKPIDAEMSGLQDDAQALLDN